ncbi:unnamed protein product [Closterium sp. NIES-65]|nr:unnamed protein product [Closterium sp. NIES-65]
MEFRIPKNLDDLEQNDDESLGYFDQLDASSKDLLIDSLATNLSCLVPSIAAFLASSSGSSSTSAADTDGGRQSRKKAVVSHSWEWQRQMPKVLKALATATSVKLSSLYHGSAPEESLMEAYCSLALTLFEDAELLKNGDVRAPLVQIVAQCAVKQGYLVQVVSGLLHLLHHQKHSPDIVTDVVVYADEQLGQASLAAAVLQDVGRTGLKEYSRANSGVHEVAEFLIALANKQPRLLAASLPLLVPHLEHGESAVLRCAIVTAISRLLARLYSADAGGAVPPAGDGGAEGEGAEGDEDGEGGRESAGGVEEEGPAARGAMRARLQRLRSKQGLLAVLMERARDQSAHVRSRVMQAWAWLCGEKAVPLGHWNAVAELAVGRLEDKSSLVRKNALQLLGEMLHQNPFGPSLRVAPFEVTLEKARVELAAMEESRRRAEQQEAREGGEGDGDGEGEGEGMEGAGNEGAGAAAAAVEVGVVGDSEGGVGDDSWVDSQATQGDGEGQGEGGKAGGAAGGVAEGLPDGAAGVAGVAGAAGAAGGAGAAGAAGKAVLGRAFGVEQTRTLVASLSAGLQFCRLLAAVTGALAALLGSSAVSDVEGAILLLTALQHFRVDGASERLKKILPLVRWDTSVGKVRSGWVGVGVGVGGESVEWGEMVGGREGWQLKDGWEGAILLLTALQHFRVDGASERLKKILPLEEEGRAFERVLAALLGSSAVSDVEGAILLLTALQHFRVDGASERLKKILPLVRYALEGKGVDGVGSGWVFSHDPAVRAAVEAAVLELHVKGRSSQQAARSLVALTHGASSGDLAALEVLVGTFVHNGDVTMQMVTILWDIFTFNLPGATSAESTGALILLSMAAKTRPEILNHHLSALLAIGLGRRAQSDPLLALYACIALQRVSAEVREEMGAGHRVFALLEGVISGSSLDLPERARYGVIEQAVRAVYVLHPAPERYCGVLLKKLVKGMFGQGVAVGGGGGGGGGGEGEGREGSCVSGVVDGSGEAARAAKEKAEAEAAAEAMEASLTGKKPKAGRKSTGRKSTVSGAGKRRSVAATPATYEYESEEEEAGEESVDVREEEEGPAGDGGEGGGREDKMGEELGTAVTAEAQLEALQEQVEGEIVAMEKGLERRRGEGREYLVGRVAWFVSALCRRPQAFAASQSVYVCAVLSLSKLMAIDSHFCESHLQLLFTLLRTHPHPSVRANAMVALGDLALRCPNLLQPWTPHAYTALSDGDAFVRRQALLVLSHLILNDMMKVKGHISSLAVCLEDPEPRNADLARLFFHELSKKGSSLVYNLLPDMLSHMAVNPHLSEPSLHAILRFLIAFIDKDKQREGLIDKLCHRFTNAHPASSSASSAVVVNWQRLMDNYKDVKAALEDAAVLEYLKTATGKDMKDALGDAAVLEYLKTATGKVRGL